MKRFVLLPIVLAAALVTGGGSTAASTACPAAWLPAWQKLANRIHAPVYCPSWLPDPLTGQIGGPWNNIDSVDRDRSYLIGFVWQERGEEIHVNLRGYPGRTAIPTCRTVELVGGKKHEGKMPCFSDRRGTKKLGSLTTIVYTVNQDADQWHILYAWRHAGSLYTVSSHIAPPLTFTQTVRDLDRITRSLVLVRPR